MMEIEGSGSISQRHGSGSGSTPKCHGSGTLVAWLGRPSWTPRDKYINNLLRRKELDFLLSAKFKNSNSNSKPRIRIELKCWILIRIRTALKAMQIHNISENWCRSGGGLHGK
jgi:hypothetical protein